MNGRPNENRWSIYIDIEGFGKRWETDDRALWALGELMRGIARIGRKCFPNEVERLFAHQLGDGFVIVSDFNEASLDRCANIAITLMRHVMAHNSVARAAISEGDLGDIVGCYPQEVFEKQRDKDSVWLGAGLMTLTPVMGSALTRAVAVDKRGPKGPLLLIAANKSQRLGEVTKYLKPACNGVYSIDWVHASSISLDEIATKSGLSFLSQPELENALATYCKTHELPENWVSSVRTYLEVVV